MASLNISASNLPSIIHNSMPVITTDLLADVYETEIQNIKTNHSRNRDRFIEGKHFFNLTGSILKDFKNRVTLSNPVEYNRLPPRQVVGKNARSLILWTERGAARHAKMLDTDRAWDVFEILEDNYFTKHKPNTRIGNSLPNNASTEELLALVDQLQRTIHEGEFIPAGQVAKEYSFPRTRKNRIELLDDFMRNPKKDVLHNLLTYLKKDGHNVDEAERTLRWVRESLLEMNGAMQEIRTHHQYVESLISRL
ncbi:ORF6N domain-containing protein [Proteus mirabilis]|uniref:ORF6N domain-containing protein n=1 Tax=Proteus mirabilis TaxID=584 RepID=UPI0018C505BF|nr:ORF6N domain-containing protein [Proteus mirabilis]EHF3472201.1 ORF6N domain-containing protein [Proteus mirabilis]MBG6002546.1 ORF6N domain-containing protein [Proteus mirabilis]MDF7489377.1 ORF6N domain-containing protein [Proteus mirabilis]HEK0527028.1 ORF6N domain-containing protein [Proteus mirabilis]